MPRHVKAYGFNGLAGCVTQRRARETGRLVGVYHGLQSNLERDPETPWITVCEAHGACVCHRTLRLALDWAAEPTGWCEDCREPPASDIIYGNRE